LIELDTALRKLGGRLIVRHGLATDKIPKLARELGVDAVFTNSDYEPLAVTRDENVAGRLFKISIDFHTFKDQVILERRPRSNSVRLA
jgi:deoxyribodipyrimidine photo-lyase